MRSPSVVVERRVAEGRKLAHRYLLDYVRIRKLFRARLRQEVKRVQRC